MNYSHGGKCGFPEIYLDFDFLTDGLTDEQNGQISLDLMAHEERASYFQKNVAEQITKNTIADIFIPKKELTSIKKDGVAFDNEEYILGRVRPLVIIILVGYNQVRPHDFLGN